MWLRQRRSGAHSLRFMCLPPSHQPPGGGREGRCTSNASDVVWSEEPLEQHESSGRRCSGLKWELAHAEGGRLLDEVHEGWLVVHNEDRDLDGALHGALVWTEAQKRGVMSRRH